MIGIIGDLHLKENLGYADYISDRRVPEEKKVLDFIVKSLEDCDKIVFLGDQLNSRTSSPHTIKKFVNFLERFNGKELFILAGNHEKFGDGRSAMDFLKEITNKKWTVITDEVLEKDGMVFCPFFTKAELEATDNKDAIKKIMEKLPDGKVLFAHHTISDTLTASGISTNAFSEPILPKKKLEDKYGWVIGGHIHNPQSKGKTTIAGAIFNNEVGELKRYIWKLNFQPIGEGKAKIDEHIVQIELPGRAIYKLENPTDEELKDIKKDSIIKVILTKKITNDEIEELKTKLKRFDAYLLLEQIPKQRKKLHFGEGESLLEFDIEQLLELYAKEKKVDINKLKHGFELIK